MQIYNLFLKNHLSLNGKDLSLSHTYQESGKYSVEVIGTTNNNKIMKAKTEFYLGTLEKDKYALDISIYQRGGNVFRFSPIYKGDIDKITWVVDDNLAQSETLAPTESIIKKFTEPIGTGLFVYSNVASLIMFV